MKIRLLLLAGIMTAALQHSAQSIVDPCFHSLEELGYFYRSDDIRNICRCFNPYYASDIIEWDGTSWLGALERSYVDLPPPESCQTRAIWMSEWTTNGEGFALRLDTTFQEGKTYSFTFTYASEGAGSGYGGGSGYGVFPFAPDIYTTDYKYESLVYFTHIGQLPAAGSTWTTNTITFTASKEQSKHNWLIIYGHKSAGIVLSNCLIQNPVTVATNLKSDTTICAGTPLELTLPGGDYSYQWSTGETTQSISVEEPGTYYGELHYHNCFSSDSIVVHTRDCEVRLIPPNFFSPGVDQYNPRFLPIDYNEIEWATVNIYNRWGSLIFTGEFLHEGWDGTIDGREASPGVYFYEVTYEDTNGEKERKKGTITVAY